MARRTGKRRTGVDMFKGTLIGGVLCSAGAMPLMAGDIDVEFSGTLITDPCEVKTESEDQTIEFNPISARRFIDHNESTPVSFSIWLRECDLSLGEQVSVTFYGENTGLNPALFAVTGTAEGIAMAITDSSGHPVLPGESQDQITLVKGDNQLMWQARIQSTVGQQVKEGEFQSVLTFSLEYE